MPTILTLHFTEISTALAEVIEHERAGGRHLKRYVANLPYPGQELRLMIGREPAGKTEGMIWHVSASVGLNGIIDPLRAPNDMEWDGSRFALPRLIEFENGELPAFEEIESSHQVRHFWEVEA